MKQSFEISISVDLISKRIHLEFLICLKSWTNRDYRTPRFYSTKNNFASISSAFSRSYHVVEVGRIPSWYRCNSHIPLIVLNQNRVRGKVRKFNSPLFNLECIESLWNNAFRFSLTRMKVGKRVGLINRSVWDYYKIGLVHVARLVNFTYRLNNFFE